MAIRQIVPSLQETNCLQQSKHDASQQCKRKANKQTTKNPNTYIYQWVSQGRKSRINFVTGMTNLKFRKLRKKLGRYQNLAALAVFLHALLSQHYLLPQALSLWFVLVAANQAFQSSGVDDVDCAISPYLMSLLRQQSILHLPRTACLLSFLMTQVLNHALEINLMKFFFRRFVL